MHRLFIAVIILVLNTASVASDEWELENDSDGIKVYTKKINVKIKDEKTELLAFRGVAIVDQGTLDSYRKILTDVPNFKKWLHNTYESSTIKTLNSNSWIAYQKIKTPWPTTDRDLSLIQNMKYSSDYVILDMKLYDKHNADPCCVSMEYFDGSWSISQLGENKIKIQYEAAYHSGGIVPPFISDMFLVDVPFYSIKNLIEYSDNK